MKTPLSLMENVVNGKARAYGVMSPQVHRRLESGVVLLLEAIMAF